MDNKRWGNKNRSSQSFSAWRLPSKFVNSESVAKRYQKRHHHFSNRKRPIGSRGALFCNLFILSSLSWCREGDRTPTRLPSADLESTSSSKPPVFACQVHRSEWGRHGAHIESESAISLAGKGRTSAVRIVHMQPVHLFFWRFGGPVTDMSHPQGSITPVSNDELLGQVPQPRQRRDI